jgi:hypothetical protein
VRPDRAHARSDFIGTIEELKTQGTYFPHMLHHLAIVANSQVRNVGTLAGNLMLHKARARASPRPAPPRSPPIRRRTRRSPPISP